jgi:hypothetical protein
VNRSHTIAIRGPVPSDLDERVALAHARAIESRPKREPTAAGATATAEVESPRANKDRSVVEG